MLSGFDLAAVFLLLALCCSAQAQDPQACSCTGDACGNGAIEGNQGDIFTAVSGGQVTEFFGGGAGGAGWTCRVPTRLRGEGGPLACFCENFCGNGGVGGDPGTFRLGLTREQVDTSFGGGEAGNRTGWLCGDYRGDFDPQNVTPPRPAFRPNAGLSDAWFDPATDGQGFYTAVFAEAGVMALAWFTFDVQAPAAGAAAVLGGPGQRWLTAAGPFDGRVATLTVDNVVGGRFDQATPPVQREGNYGAITVEFHDCDSATIDYELPGLALSGSIDVVRVVKENVAVCEALSGSGG